MKYTYEEVKEKLKEEGVEEDRVESLLNVIVVEYNNLARNGYCKMKGEKLKIPDWNEFLFSITAFDDACGPYTEKDVRMAK